MGSKIYQILRGSALTGTRNGTTSLNLRMKRHGLFEPPVAASSVRTALTRTLPRGLLHVHSPLNSSALFLDDRSDADTLGTPRSEAQDSADGTHTKQLLSAL